MALNKIFGPVSITIPNIIILIQIDQSVYEQRGGWSGGAKVLSKNFRAGRPTNLDISRARAYCTCSRCGWGLFGSFLSLVYLFPFLSPLSGRRPDID